MKKLCKEEKRVLKKDITHKLVFIFFFLFQNYFSQIPLNGFCKLEEISVAKNLTNIFAIDFNNDGFRDLILYNPQQKNYYSLAANGRASLQKPVSHFSSNSISTLHQLTSSFVDKKVCALINNSKEVSLVNISAQGSISFSNKIKLDGSASSIDIKKDPFGDSELIASGVGVDGIKVFREKNRKLFLEDNIKGKLFTNAIYIDLNYDSYNDIVAFDVYSNSLVFFFNNRFGDYDEERSIGILSNVKNIQAADFNSDRFTDLIINSNGKLTVLLGDSVSSFQRQDVFKIDEKISVFKIYDFNGDGFNDIAFINENKNELKISFGNSNNSFYKPISILKRNNLVDIEPFYDRGGRKLAVLSSDGFVYLISKISLNDDEFNISFGNDSSCMVSFDYRNDGFKDFAFVDETTNTLKIGISARRNLFSNYYEITLQEKADEIIVDDKQKEIKTFVCYKKEKNAVEIIRFNFSSGKILRNIFYTDNKIKQIKLFSDRIKDRMLICAITEKNKNLFLETNELTDFKSIGSKISKVASNVENSTLRIAGDKYIYSLIKFNQNYDLVSLVFDSKLKTQNTRLTFELQEKDSIKTSLTFIDELFAKTNPVVFLLTINRKSVLYILSENKNYRFDLGNYVDNKLSIRYLYNPNYIEFFIYNAEKNNILNVLVNEKFNLSNKTEIHFQHEIKNYIVSKFDVRNKYLIFANKNSITFRKI